MSKPRRHFSAPQKAEIVRRHLAGKEPVSNLADEFQLQPTQIHAWVKQDFLDRAEQAFAASGRPVDVFWFSVKWKCCRLALAEVE